VDVVVFDPEGDSPVEDRDKILKKYIAETILKAPTSKYDRRMLMNLDHND
jgi:hypothetical protein